MVEMITYYPEMFNETWNKISNVTEKRMKQYKLNTHLISGYRKDEEIPKEVKDDLISEGCPESWFSPVEEEFEKGDWVVTKSEILFKITHIDDETYGGYGFDIIDGRCWFNEDYNVSLLRHIERKATEKEVTNALIAEAKRRGYKEGTKIDNSNLGHNYSFGTLNSDRPYYISCVDVLCFGSGYIYKQGKWAEIIDEPIQINGYEAEFKDGYVQFGCAKIDNRFFTEMAKQSTETDKWDDKGLGNRSIEAVKIGEGLFTIKDLEQIAKRIKDEDDYEIKGSGCSFNKGDVAWRVS